MIKVNGIEVTKGCTVKLRCGGMLHIDGVAVKVGTDYVDVFFSGGKEAWFCNGNFQFDWDDVKADIAFLDMGKKAIRTGGHPFDIIEVIPPAPTFKRGDRVRKKGNKGQWQGYIVGEYSTECTPEGYAVESERELNSVQIYPASALEHVEDIT